MFGLVGVIGGIGIAVLIGAAGVGVGLAGVIGVETGLTVAAWAGVGLIGAVGMLCVFGVVDEAVAGVALFCRNGLDCVVDVAGITGVAGAIGAVGADNAAGSVGATGTDGAVASVVAGAGA